MNGKSSVTALMAAFGRAFHTANVRKPVFADTKARELITDEEYTAMGRYILDGVDFFCPDQKEKFSGEEETLRYLVHTQIAPTPLARAAFCEERLKIFARMESVQYVILGAGMDTFAFRETDFMETHKVFEVDHPLTQADKLNRVHRAELTIPDNLRYVAVDFSKDDLKAKLLEAGFDPTKKSFFSWLGVSYYLSKEEIEETFKRIASLSVKGSRVIFDYADEKLFDSEIRRVRNMLAMASAGGEPMKSCFEYDQLQRLLEKHRFIICERMDAQDIQERYFAGQEAELTAFEHIHYVTAVYQ